MAVEKYPLHEILSPINREERLKIQENWRRISSYLNSIDRELRILWGGDIDELLQKINTAIEDAEYVTDETLQLIDVINERLKVMATAISNTNTATNNANTARTNANNAASAANTAATGANTARDEANAAKNAANTAAQNANTAKDNANAATKLATDAANSVDAAKQAASQAADSANTAKTNADNATALTISAKNQALQAVQDVVNAIANMRADLAAFKATFEHKSTYQNATQYRKNNEVLHMGSTWRAKQDIGGTPPPSDPFTLSAHWQLVARRGEDAPTNNDAVEVWRGTTAPTNTALLWFKDLNFMPGQTIKLYKSNVPPTNTNDIWLKPRGV